MSIIKVDDREKNKELWSAFEELAYEKEFEFEKAHLLTGDVICGNVVIERKEANDFIGSIMDGRLKEQAAKMSLSFKHKYIIIEGNLFKTKSDIHHNAIIGKLTSLAIAHNIHIIPVDNPTHFVYACYSVINKHIENETFNPEEHNVLQYKVNDEEVLTAMIYQISGIGWEKAKAIAEKCNYSLKTFIKKATKERLMKLDGIGEVIAEKIMSFVNK